MELLVPVKDKQNAIMAINLGVAAIYCSGPLYSARSKAGISFVDLAEIIEYAHLYNTKVYVTLNTLIKDDIFNDVITYIDKLVALNIDALIIQDLGLFKIINQRYSNLDIHISTQMHVHNIESVAFVVENGANRVVLARELNIEQVANIKEKYSKLELETFVHGALCTSYSSQCYYSCFFNDGSGNFGTCQQNCRKAHTFTNKNEYLLSLKDLCLANNVNDLMNISDSLKIEGRLKGQEYLYSTIKYYQSVLNGNPDQEMFDLMQIAFNRTYTKGRLFYENGQVLGNKVRINNHGLLIGEVVACDNNWLYLNLDKQLTRLDNIRFVKGDYETGMVVDKLYQNDEVEYVKKGQAKIKSSLDLKGAKIYLVKTRRYEKEISEYQQKYFVRNTLDVKVEVFIDKPIKVTIGNQEYLSDFVVEKAMNKGMNLIDIKKQLMKTNDTPFIFQIEMVGDVGIFVVKSLLNEFRRNIVQEEANKKLKRDTNVVNDYQSVKTIQAKQQAYNYMVRTKDQAEALKEFGLKKIYVDNLMLLDEIGGWFEQVIPVLPRVVKDDYFHDIVTIVKDYSSLMVSELGMLNYFKDDKVLETNYSLNIINRYALEILKENNVEKVILSVETDDDIEITGIECSKMIYGYLPLMIMDYCPINQNKKDKCENCCLCQEKQYYIYDDKKRKLALVYRGYNMIELFSDKPINRIKETKGGFVFFTIEDYNKTKKVLKQIRN